MDSQLDTITLKADMHLHTNEDPQDNKKIKYTSYELIDHLEKHNFDVFSITLHNHMFEKQKMNEVRQYAKSKGMIFIPGIEKTVEKSHVLIFNMDKKQAERIGTYSRLEDTFRDYGIQDIRKRDSILIVASHPHFPSKAAIGDKLFNRRKLFHGLEYNSFYLRWNALNFNEQTVYEADRWGKTLLGSTDAHKLEQIGNTYTNITVPTNMFTFNKITDKEEIKKLIKNCSDEEYERFNRYIICYIKKGYTTLATRPLSVKYVLNTIVDLFVKN